MTSGIDAQRQTAGNGQAGTRQMRGEIVRRLRAAGVDCGCRPWRAAALSAHQASRARTTPAARRRFPQQGRVTGIV